MQFYVLRQSRESGARTDFFNAGDPDNVGDAPRCPQCGQYTGPLVWLPPYRVELELVDGDPGDLAFGGASDFLVSERFKRLYDASGLRGLLGFEPVELVRVKGPRGLKGKVPPYYHVTVGRDGAVVDQVASEIVRLNPDACTSCGAAGLKRLKRVVVIPETWTGEDIFYARNLAGTRICTDRFREFCTVNTVTNAVFIAAEGYHIDFYPWDKKV